MTCCHDNSLLIRPLLALPTEHGPGHWSERLPSAHRGRDWYFATRRVLIDLPGVVARRAHGDHWTVLPVTGGARIDILPGFRWDGASGPAITDDAARVASLVHDLLGERIAGNGFVGRHYFQRHWVYSAILLAQNASYLRALYSFLAVAAWGALRCLIPPDPTALRGAR